jgi:hypothetical protein
MPSVQAASRHAAAPLFAPAILILIFDDPELPTVSSGCYDVSLFPQAEEEAG